MQVEDHPFGYNTFEGTIPKGQYGGGTVMIWDQGSYTSPDGGEDEIRAALAAGRLKIMLQGERLQGMWTLARMRKERQWLLIKHHDEHDVPDDDLPSQDVPSVVTGRRMSEIADGSAATVGKGAGPALSLLPMPASVGSELPAGDDWAFEPKYDGVRVLAFVDGQAVALVSRNGRDKAAQFPEVVEALRALSVRRKRPFVLDGEVVPRHGKRVGRFQDLQQRIGQTSESIIASHAEASPVALVAFDLLLDGTHPLASEPWTTRRRRLERLLAGTLAPGLMLGEVARRDGKRMLARARHAGWEGIMAKRVDAPYAPGERTTAWRKLKIEGRQELVVGGWTDPRGSRHHLGALLVGYWQGDDFVYAGRVGAGLTQQGLAELFGTLHRIQRKTSPFSDSLPRATESVHWVKPEVVVEVKFNEWTADGRLRQPVFVGVRDDKDARAVVREPSGASTSATSPVTRPRTKRPKKAITREVTAKVTKVTKVTKITKEAAKKAAGRSGVAAALRTVEAEGGGGVVDIPGTGPLKVSHLDKVYFPKARCTKGDLMRYYDRVSPVLLPLIADRPLVLKRYPNGVTAKPFFQQNAPDDAPPGLRVDMVPSESTAGRRIIGGDLYTLLYCVQLGAIDVNPWHSRLGSLECPDYTILDLDPGPKAAFAAVIRVALALKELLDAAKLTAAIKTSGARGLHIVIPLPLGTSEEAGRLVAQILAEQVATEQLAGGDGGAFARCSAPGCRVCRLSPEYRRQERRLSIFGTSTHGGNGLDAAVVGRNHSAAGSRRVYHGRCR